MAVGVNTTGFGKREVHQLWTERRTGARNLSVSPLRAAVAVLILGGAALAFGSAGLALIDGRPRLPLPDPVALAMGVVLEAAALAALCGAAWAVLSAFRGRPALRLDRSRMVLETKRGPVVLLWDEVAIRIGALFARIDAAGAGADRRFLVPVALLPGGSVGLRQAVRGVCPQAERTF